MSSIDTRGSFFPNSKGVQTDSTKKGGKAEALKQGNSAERTDQLNAKTAGDAKVTIPEGVKDFSKIKKIASAAPEVDNSEKIARLKAQIAAGTYEVDYDGLADKILQSEF